MLRKYRVWIIVLAVVLAAGGGYTYYAAASQPAQIVEDDTLRTTTARQGDLVLYASGTGTLVAADEVELSFGISGEVAEVFVEVGDQVQVGDVLARLEEGESLTTLEASVTSAELSVLSARQALEDLDESATMQAALAQQALAEALDNLESAEYTWQVQQEGYRATGETIAAAEANLVLAEQQVDRAQAEYNQVSGRAEDDPARALALSNLVAAKQQRDSVLRELNWYTGSPNTVDQMLLDAEVALAQATLEEAESTWEVLQNGPDPDDVALAEAQLANAEAQLAKAQETLADAIEDQEKIDLVAPMDGTILELNLQVGQTAPTVAATMADLSQPHMEIFLDETDLANVRLGLEAEVIFDALPDDTFSGTVVWIDPSLYTSQGLSAIRALIQLEDSDLGDQGTLPLGLSAAVDVIAGRAEDAVLVPIEALREISPGEYAVFVLDGDEPELRFVEVGLMDYTSAAITSGLEAGDVITTGIVETG